ncbi:MAG: N utilization substance protein B-like protein [candidate division CPR2 bacterium GW2011_GWC1_41_48]|uniref:Transcription antitermination protein NusB n=1 Tax=candidate division CPR2 bacterium GW2011_GWC1_41_48 TaxID=1618344 RepID=A0A0G0YHH9_UNCC2|nr:MAG: N utilization substance protein B-like protein [candidate division CPR2 bacterium GW2011_GWC2_39_35]KKR29366.1 MAG: N utilization substance protein B-like protein [candidate division CPR2 bacterium GW2011_GWD2_39_7]KKS09021.1 MAG: N utilization substance protein B-like protein [candidate division CPR2 bacterium GW2011_GWC1_41_48]OGB71188.1 MAG: transcription antitermination factor NusB [candidate division CPR2 bacterium GWD2_39_7]HCL99923.1 transcription antitermination factor NusB [can
MASNRHLARIVAMQTLYEWDFRKIKLGEEIPREQILEVLKRNTEEFAKSIDNIDFISVLVGGTLDNVKEIDSILAPAAPEWPIDQIAGVDKAVLRLGIYELIFSREVPPKVAINEAVELAKAFGGENSSKFVNGVLGTVYRNSDIYEEEAEAVEASGGLVYRKENDDIYFLLIKDRFEKWTVPKGRVEDDEDTEKAAIRETSEETGIKDLNIESKLGRFELHSKKDGEKVLKKVEVFLIRTNEENIDMAKVVDPEVKDVRWFKAENAVHNAGYENTEDLINEAIRIITKKHDND